MQTITCSDHGNEDCRICARGIGFDPIIHSAPWPPKPVEQPEGELSRYLYDLGTSFGRPNRTLPGREAK